MVDPDMCAALRRKRVCRLFGRVWTPWSKHKQSQLKISPVEIGSDLLLLRQVAGWLDLHLHCFISSRSRVKACRGWLIYQRKYVLCSYASFTFSSNMQKSLFQGGKIICGVTDIPAVVCANASVLICSCQRTILLALEANEMLSTKQMVHLFTLRDKWGPFGHWPNSVTSAAVPNHANPPSDGDRWSHSSG